MSMSTPKSQWTWEFIHKEKKNEFQYLIVDYKRRTALLRLEGEKWTLPGVLEPNGSDYWWLIPELLTEIGVKWSLWPLYNAWTKQAPMEYFLRGDNSKCVVIVEYCEEDSFDAPGYEWRSLSSTNVYHLHEDAVRRIEEEVKVILDGGHVKKRAPWQHPGWLSEAISILESAVGAKVNAPLDIHRASYRGAVFGAETAKGTFFVKCSNPFSNDARYSEAMTKIVPQHCPEPVFVDAEKGLLITTDFGEPSLAMFCSHWEAVLGLRVLAEVQQKSMGKTEELLSIEMLDCRLEKFGERFDDVIGHPVLDMLESANEGCYRKFNELKERIGLLRKHADEVKEKMQAMVDNVMEMPVVVLHNDLAINNFFVNKRSGEVQILDWEQGAVGHPLMESSLDFFKEEAQAEYFKAWRKYGTEEELREMNAAVSDFSALAVLLVTLNQMTSMEEHGDIVRGCTNVSCYISALTRHIAEKSD